jgi:hypothetical protein
VKHELDVGNGIAEQRFRFFQFTAGGGTSGSNLTLLDTPSVDSLDEFKLERSTYDAQYGRSGEPVEFVKSVYRGDHTESSIGLHANPDRGQGGI